MSTSNDQMEQEHKLNKADQEEAEQAKLLAEARAAAAEQAKSEIKARIEDAKQKEVGAASLKQGNYNYNGGGESEWVLSTSHTSSALVSAFALIRPLSKLY
jgi:hypothetical protein